MFKGPSGISEVDLTGQAWNSHRILATLIRLLGDFDLAEDALHDAFRAALERWPREGLPTNPRSWLISTGRFKAIDNLRRRARFDTAQSVITEQLYPGTLDANAADDESIADDRLRLIFTCCHPALAPEARVALTLREVCGLTTEEIAHAFLTTPSTLAQRPLPGHWAQPRCPHCRSIIYSRRHQRCGVCEEALPVELLFPPAEARRVQSLLQSEQRRYRAWLAKAFDQAMAVAC